MNKKCYVAFPQVKVSYVLRKGNDGGKIIDSSQSFKFRLGVGEVVPGFDEAVKNLRVGGTVAASVPPSLG